MSNSSKYKDNWNFCANYGPAEKNQPKVSELLRKIKKKLRLSALDSPYWLLLFYWENKYSNADNFLPEFDIANLKSL